MASSASGIYMILDTVSGRRYIGSAMRIDARWREHRRGLALGHHHSKFMLRCWRKRPESFEFKVMLYCSKENLIMYEQILIDYYKPEFNSAPKAGSQLGFRMSPESKAKLSEAAKRTRNFTGKTHSEESKRKISESRKGKGGDKGWTQERRDKISSSNKGKVVSLKQREMISRKLRGHVQSKETIDKRSAKLRGRKMPSGFSEAASSRMKGVSLTESHCISIGRSKASLSDEQVRSIRSLLKSGCMNKSVAIYFSVDSSVISEIKTGKSYRWVD